MDNKYVGELGTNVYGLTLDEMRIGHIRYTAAQTVASDDDGLLASFELGAAGLSTSTFLNEMPYARNLTVAASAAQTGKVTVFGTDIAGNPIAEVFTLNGVTKQVGVFAFKTVTKVVCPAKLENETINLGWGELIGLPMTLASAPFAWAMDDGTQATAPTFAVDASVLAKNVVDFDGSHNGSVLDLFVMI